MLVFCVGLLVGSKPWPGSLKSLARQAQKAQLGRLKSLARQAQKAQLGRLKLPAQQSQPPALSFPQLLVLQVPNMLRLVVDRDRLNLGVV